MIRTRFTDGLPTFFPFTLPATWTPEQAWAVTQLLEELRDSIWQHYEVQIHELIRAQQGDWVGGAGSDRVGAGIGAVDEPPF